MKALCLRLKWIFALCLLSLLAGCLFRGQEQTSTETQVLRRSTDPVTVDFWHTFNDEEAGTLKEALSSFKQEFPYITVNLQQVPFSDALNKYKTLAQAGNAPDIFRAEIAWTTELASMGYLMSLYAFVDQKAQADFVPQSLAYSRYKNHIWGLPQVTDCLALFYNKRLVGPEAPKTLEQFLLRGQELTDVSKKQYAFFYRGDPYWFTPFVWAFGGDLIDSQTLKVKIAEEPAVKALNFLIYLPKK